MLPPIGPYRSLPAACLDYDPEAPAVAQRLASIILDKIPTASVEHIGSTAVPGCAGKGVIDLLLVYPGGLLEQVKDALELLGFQHQTAHDRFPEGRPMRTGSIEHQGQLYRLHVHVIAAASVEIDVLRTFRNRLRADPSLVAGYTACKRQIIADGIVEPMDYCERKGDFIAVSLGDSAIPTRSVSEDSIKRLPNVSG